MTPARRRHARALTWTLAALAVSLVVFELTPVDVALQDHLWSPERGWWVDPKSAVWKTACYHVPKALVIAIGVGCIALLVGPPRWRERIGVERRALGVAVLTLATLPLLAAAGKALLRVHCPYELRQYGGAEPYVKLCGCHSADDPPKKPGGCFPAGHASGGFGLLGLSALARDPRRRRAIVVLALAVGWWMGGYQMLRGAHFLSHTTTTMLLGFVVFAAWSLALEPRVPAAAAPRALDGSEAAH